MPDQFLHGVEVVEIDNGLRPIQTVKSSIIGFVGTAPDADAAIFPENQPVLVTGPRMAADLGATGTLRDAYLAAYAQGVSVAIVVRVATDEDAADTTANVLGTATAYSGVYALLAAASITGQTPRILAAPGWTSGDPADGVNPVVSALLTVAEKLRAVVIKDGPNTTEADAITDAGLYGSQRLYIVDPAVRVFDAAAQGSVTKPASAYVAGLLSKRDQERGFWWSPSNQEVRGITGTARPIGFAMSEPETEANRLNEAKVATIVRRNGFRLWGNRSASSDALCVPVRAPHRRYDLRERGRGASVGHGPAHVGPAAAGYPRQRAGVSGYAGHARCDPWWHGLAGPRTEHRGHAESGAAVP